MVRVSLGEGDLADFVLGDRGLVKVYACLD